MCDFPSWIKTNDGTICFLIDKDVKRFNFEWENSIGHQAIKKVFPNIKGKEDEGFPCPPEVVKAINNNKMNKMMKTYYRSVTVNSKGELHSKNDKPAIIYSDGDKYWYKNGKLHRDNDKPSIIYFYGTKHWYKNGVLHRDNDRPAIIFPSGTKEWYKNGKLHRDNDKPSIIDFYGTKHWYKNGVRHRDNDKPAIIFSNGNKEWYKNGKFIK